MDVWLEEVKHSLDACIFVFAGSSGDPRMPRENELKGKIPSQP